MALNHAISLGIVIIVVAACLAPALCSAIDCDSIIERAAGYKICFNDQGLHIPDVINRFLTDGDSNADDIMFILLPKYGHKFCTNFSAELQKAASCIYQIDNDCSPVHDKSLFPTSEAYARYAVLLCENYQNMDFNCIKRKHTAAATCIRDKKGEILSGRTTQQRICKNYAVAGQCSKKEYKECGCTSSKVFSYLFYDIFMSATCDKDSNPVVCNATNPNTFINDGLGNGSSTVASLFLGLVVALAILVYTGL